MIPGDNLRDNRFMFPIYEDPVKKISGKMAEQIAGIREKLIKEAIAYVVGEDFKVEDVKNRGQFLVYPDGHEEFRFDDVPMLEFHGFEAAPPKDLLDSKAEVKLLYKKLY